MALGGGGFNIMGRRFARSEALKIDGIRVQGLGLSPKPLGFRVTTFFSGFCLQAHGPPLSVKPATPYTQCQGDLVGKFILDFAEVNTSLLRL